MQKAFVANLFIKIHLWCYTRSWPENCPRKIAPGKIATQQIPPWGVRVWVRIGDDFRTCNFPGGSFPWTILDIVFNLCDTFLQMLSMCDWNVSLLLKELLLIYSFSIMMLVFTLELQIKWDLSGLTFIWLSLIHLKSVFEAFWISLLSQCKDNQKRTFESPIITNLGKYLKTIYRQPKNWLLHMPYFFGFCDNQSQNIFRPGQNQLIFLKHLKG